MERPLLCGSSLSGFRVEERTAALGRGVGEVAGRVLSEVAGERIFASGGQLSVMRDGELIVDVAVGETGWGEELSSGHLHNVYCLLKPLPYLLLGGVLESSGFGPDDLLDGAVDLPSWCPAGVTFRGLACHDVGLGEPTATLWRMTPEAGRSALLAQVGRGSGPAYSELTGGLVAERVIEQVSGRPANQYCLEELLRPLGLADDILVDAERCLAVRDRVSVPVAGLPVMPFPVLSELLPGQISEIRLALGALATMRGVARFFAAVGEVMAGVPQAGLPSPGFLSELLDDDRPFRYDPVLNREAKWAAGLMVGLRQQGISRLAGLRSVGHAGGLANSVAVYDPLRAASVAVYLNGVGSSFEDMALPRQQVLDAVLEAVHPG